jgi:hypothetical protein
MIDVAKGPGKPGRSGAASARTVRIAALLGLGLVAVVVGLLLIVGGSGGSSKSGTAEIVNVEGLQKAAASQGRPIYWAGERAGSEIELSQPDPSRTYVRYLTGGAKVGDPRAIFLTVATYAHDNPVGALRHQGREPGGVLASAPGGATVYFNRNRPHSVYLAYPGVDVQIEVYDPDFKRALRLVESGQIVSAG